MGPTTPETTANNHHITNLTSRITEHSGFGEITVRADNVGAQKWAEMLSGTKADGRERGLFVHRNLLLHTKFSTSKIAIGTQVHPEKRIADVAPQPEDLGIKGFILPVVATVHTHPKTMEVQHLKTLIPGDEDLQHFFGAGYSAMVTIDGGGAHLLIRTGEPLRRDEPPPPDVIDNLIKEEAAKNGTVADVQKRLNGRLSEYGLSYFYAEQLTPSTDGTITFKAP